VNVTAPLEAPLQKIGETLDLGRGPCAVHRVNVVQFEADPLFAAVEWEQRSGISCPGDVGWQIPDLIYSVGTST
jgi:hypothetical protein